MQNAVVDISDSLVLAFAHQDQARQLIDAYACPQWHSLAFIDMSEFENSLDVMTSPAKMQYVVQTMKHVTQKIQEAMEAHAGKTLVLCQAPEDQPALQETALLLGAFAILVEEWDLDSVVDAFPDFAHRLMAAPGLDLDRSKYSVSVLDCWKALLHARQRGWMSWRTSPDDEDQPLLIAEARRPRQRRHPHPCPGRPPPLP